MFVKIDSAEAVILEENEVDAVITWLKRIHNKPAYNHVAVVG